VFRKLTQLKWHKHCVLLPNNLCNKINKFML